MKLIEYKEQLNMMKNFGGMVKDLEYSEANTLSQDRKDLHRNMILPMMDQEYNNAKKELDGIETDLINMGYTNPDQVDVDEVLSNE